MDGLNRTCTFCDKTFSTITNLNKHKRNVHKEGLDITSKKVRNKSFICPKCEYETFSTFNILLKHLKERHDFVSNFEEKTFVSEDEFDLWRFQVENETCCEFVQHNSAVVLADVTKKKYLHCNQSFRLSKSILKNCKRTFESQGSSITQKTCPARIEVEVQKNKNNVTVYARFWKTHLGHEPDIGHYGRVKKHCRHKKISSNLYVQTILQQWLEEPAGLATPGPI